MTNERRLETIKGNMVIARYMGTPEEELFFPDGKTRNFRYHMSWDALMPVVEKCVSSMEINTYHYDQIHDALWSCNIDAIYDAVVEFLNWYNEEINPKRTFKVPVRRIGYSFKTIEVEAHSEEEAEEIALEEAGSYEFSESSSEYEIDA